MPTAEDILGLLSRKRARHTSLNLPPGLTFLVGAPGSGKTQMLINLCVEAEGQRVVFFGDCEEFRLRCPYEQIPRGGLFQGVGSLIDRIRIAEEGEVMLVDDIFVHWPSPYDQESVNAKRVAWMGNIHNHAIDQGVIVLASHGTRTLHENLSPPGVVDGERLPYPSLKLKGGL